ncbi:hypothetical protein EML15_04235 [Corynebacterium sp. sy017]|uniref:hypothetical protein n=1 Tax=unclassified Corynebacterium TaxID=2624378 RepID=UPI0011870E38|nr:MULTISPECIES: hypothetical protein [unclassified Corynebacterium]MBP3088355.1 hypothetical protein [Corynebacterium sp. sy017]TSD91671.1 hypothetical protein ELY17_04235 [Corynebacterium sp. SY003]
MIIEKIVVMTTDGALSGPLEFHIKDGVPWCRYSYAADDVSFIAVEAKDDSSAPIRDNADLLDRIESWKINGKPPRDADDNVIAFRY